MSIASHKLILSWTVPHLYHKLFKHILSESQKESEGEERQKRRDGQNGVERRENLLYPSSLLNYPITAGAGPG